MIIKQIKMDGTVGEEISCNMVTVWGDELAIYGAAKTIIVKASQVGQDTLVYKAEINGVYIRYSPSEISHEWMTMVIE